MQLCIFHLIVRHFRIHCIEWNISFALTWCLGSPSANGRLIVSVHLCTHEQRSALLMCCHMNYEPKKKRGKKKFDACRVVHIWTISLNNTNALASYYLFPSCMPVRMLVVAALEPSREKKRDYSFQYSTRILTGAGRLIVH